MFSRCPSCVNGRQKPIDIRSSPMPFRRPQNGLPLAPRSPVIEKRGNATDSEFIVVYRPAPYSALFLLLCSMGILISCGEDAEELRSYLEHELPQCTTESANITASFQALIQSKGPTKSVETELTKQVIAPYKGLVTQCEAYKPTTEAVQTRHREYIALARRQLAAFIEARRVLQQGRSLRDVAERLAQIRTEFERWHTGLMEDSTRLGIRIRP